MAYKNYKQVRIVQEKYKKQIQSICPAIDEKSGIYFLLRTDENDINYFYIGQAKHLLSRMASHMTGYQHIDLSIKKRGWFSEDNPYGWKLNILHYPESKLDEMEQHWILEYTKQGYQCRYNKTAGGQGEGKEKINEYRPARGYRDGIAQGRKNCSKEIAHLFEKHLEYKPKNDPPTKNQQKAIEKFEEFLDEHKIPEDNGALDTELIERNKYGRTVISGGSSE